MGIDAHFLSVTFSGDYGMFSDGIKRKKNGVRSPAGGYAILPPSRSRMVSFYKDMEGIL